MTAWYERNPVHAGGIGNFPCQLAGVEVDDHHAGRASDEEILCWPGHVQ
jgi:hypothetical protein